MADDSQSSAPPNRACIDPAITVRDLETAIRVGMQADDVQENQQSSLCVVVYLAKCLFVSLQTQCVSLYRYQTHMCLSLISNSRDDVFGQQYCLFPSFPHGSGVSVHVVNRNDIA